MAQETYEMQGDAAAPGDVVQLLYKAPSTPTTLRGLVVGEGLAIERVFVGRSQLTQEEAMGQAIPPDSYLIVLAKNTTEEVIVAKAACVIEGDKLPNKNPLGIQDLPQGAPTEPKPLAPVAVRSAPSPAPAPQAPVQSHIKPGANEILVLLSRGHAEELNRCLKAQALPHGATVADVTRRLDQALRGEL